MAINPEYDDEGLQEMTEFLPIEEKGEDFMIKRDGEDTEVIFGLEDEEEPPVLTDAEHFDENLADKLSQGDLDELASDLGDKVDRDEESRSDWVERMKDGLELIGVKDVPAEDVIFNGASRVNHPMILEAMVQFQSRAIEEMFPPGGPVKTVVLGNETPEVREQADRVQDFMNYQLTEMDERHFWESDQMLLYLPYAGSAFKKVSFSPLDDFTTSRFVKAHDLIVPYDATCLEDAPRITHRYELSQRDYEVLVKQGYLREMRQDPSSMVDAGPGRELADEADLRTEVRDDDDDTPLLINEVYTYHRFKWDPEDEPPKPYVITVERNTGETLAIRRNWDLDDETCRKIVNFVHYKYLPGLGFYGFGLIHLIGSLGRAASGALRLLLDGSVTSSLSGGFKSKELRGAAGEMRFTPGMWTDIDVPAEELAKGFYSPPFKEPSPALFNTLEILLGAGQRFASTTEAMTGDQSNSGPVGTTLAIIEQGSKIFSAIHKRMHVSARREFKLIARFNHLYMPEEYPYAMDGDSKSVLRDDFDDRVDVAPVSDPNIFSNTQRIAIAQAVLELVSTNPNVYDDDAMRKAHISMLKALRVPNADEYLPERREKRLDPVTENQIMLTGRMGVRAFPEQDHQAHMQAHQMFLQEIAAMGGEDMVNQLAPVLQAHMAEHMAHQYRLQIETQMGIPLPPADWQNPAELEDMPVELDNAVARAVAMNVQPPPPPQEEGGPSPEEEAMMEGQVKLTQAANEEQRRDMETAAEQRRKDQAAMAELRRRAVKEGMLPSEVRAAERAFDAGTEE